MEEWIMVRINGEGGTESLFFGTYVELNLSSLVHKHCI
jgi:hypothetical protein